MQIKQVCDALEPEGFDSSLGCQIYACGCPTHTILRFGGGDERATSATVIRLCIQHLNQIRRQIRERIEDTGC